MDIDLFETTNIRVQDGDNSVRELRKKFQINAETAEYLQGKIEEIREDNISMQDVLNCMAEISSKMDAATETKSKALLNKIQTRLQIMATNMTERQEHNKQVFEREKAEFQSWNETVQTARKWLDNEPYTEAFAQLYRIQEMSSLYEENATVRFIETQGTVTSGYMTMGQHLQSAVTEDDGARIPHIGLEVDLHNGLPFQLMMEPSDRNDVRTEMKVVLDSNDVADLELENPDKLKTNKEKIRQIMEFCERYGFSTFDLHIPRTFDGEVDENAFYDANRPHLTVHEAHMQKILHGMFDEVLKDKQTERAMAAEHEKHTQEEREKEAELAGESIDRQNVSYDAIPDESTLFSVSYEPLSDSGRVAYDGGASPLSATTSSGDNNNSNSEPEQPATPAPQQAPTPIILPNPTLEKAEILMEELLGPKGLNKKRGTTYIKKGIFHSKWTEYVVYDAPYDKDHDGDRDPKTHEAKFTYSFKLFVSVNDDGRLTFGYRFNKGDKKALINALAGKFADLGYTHINFPNGIPDDEKGLWRTALAEKGIVWVGMSLDVDKAEAMIKAAQDKHMSDENLAKYKYRLALQMEENKVKKGKQMTWQESTFVEDLKSPFLGKSWLYSPFSRCYVDHLNKKLKDTLSSTDSERGAIKKVAACNTVYKMWNIYSEAVANGGFENIDYNKFNLTQKEKDEISALMPIVLSTHHTESLQKMAKIYDILLPNEEKKAETEIYRALDENRELSAVVGDGKMNRSIVVKNIYDEARGNLDRINDDMKEKGHGEIPFPKQRVSLGINEYVRKIAAKKKTEKDAEKKEEQGNNTNGSSAFIGGNVRGRSEISM